MGISFETFDGRGNYIVAGLAILALITGVWVALGALFSENIREQIRKRPVLHAVWFVFSFLMVAGALLLFFGEVLDRIQQDGKRAFAMLELKMITEELNAYEAEYGAFPSGGSGEIMDALMGKNKRQIHFVEPMRKSLNAEHEFLDSWGTPYRIGVSHGDYAWAYSCGRDGKDDGRAAGSDDVTSWEACLREDE